MARTAPVLRQKFLFGFLDLRGADLYGAYLAPSRAEAAAEARARRLPQSAVIPVTMRLNRGYMLLEGGVAPGCNTAQVAHRARGADPVVIELNGASTQYRKVAPLGDLAAVLDRVAGDYPATSRMGLFAAALTAGIRAWTTGAALARDRFGHLDAARFQEAVIGPLRPLFDLPHSPGGIGEIHAANLMLVEPSRAAVPADTAAVASGLATLVIELLDARHGGRGTVDIRGLDEALARTYGGTLWKVARPGLAAIGD